MNKESADEVRNKEFAELRGDTFRHNIITHKYPRILVDETLSVEKAIQLLNEFDQPEGNISSKTFPKQEGGKKRKKEMAIFYLGRDITLQGDLSLEKIMDKIHVTTHNLDLDLLFGKRIPFEGIISEMDKVGYKPATIWDLLGFAIKEPELQKKFHIVALGSLCKSPGKRRVACLGYNHLLDRKRLYLWYIKEFSNNSRFLGVRK